MSLILKHLFVLFGFLFRDGRAQQGPSSLPFPHLIDFNESDIGKPVFIFSGVDYFQLPPNMVKDDFATCEEEFARCIRFTVYVTPTCAYNVPQRKVLKFEGICDLDLESCREMRRQKVPMYGITYRYRQVYYLGEGYDCEIFARRIAEGWIPRDIRDPPDNETPSELSPKGEYDFYDEIINQ